MSRANLESDANRDDESAVRAEIADAWQCEVIELPKHARVDCFLWRDGLRAVTEIKCRSHGLGQYPTLMISAEKWVRVRDLADACRVAGLLVVRFGDGAIHWANLADIPAREIDPAVRADHLDPDEVEPCVFLPVDQFKPLREQAS